jgi:hypothetical protein
MGGGSAGQGWLFPGQDPVSPLTARQLNRVCQMAAGAAGFGTWVTQHTPRLAERLLCLLSHTF